MRTWSSHMHDYNNYLSLFFNWRDLSVLVCLFCWTSFLNARLAWEPPQGRWVKTPIMSCGSHSPVTNLAQKSPLWSSASEEQVEDMNVIAKQASEQVSEIFACTCCTILWFIGSSRSVYQPGVSFDSHSSVTCGSWMHLVAFSGEISVVFLRPSRLFESTGTCF